MMRKVPRTRYDQVALLIDHPEWKEAARLYREYIGRRLHQEKFAPALAK